MGAIRLRTIQLSTTVVLVLDANSKRSHIRIQNNDTAITVYVAVGGKPGPFADSFAIPGSQVRIPLEISHNDTPKDGENPAALPYVIWSASGTPNISVKEVFQ